MSVPAGGWWQCMDMSEHTAFDSEAVDSSEQLDQLSPADSLVHRGVDDPLDEGYTAPDNWSVAQGYGNTAAEMAQGETIEQRLTQEVPEPDPDHDPGPWNPHQEPRQVGSTRAGRLVGTTGGSAEVVATDVGIAGAAASAEEAAMHIINEEDLAHSGEDD